MFGAPQKILRLCAPFTPISTALKATGGPGDWGLLPKPLLGFLGSFSFSSGGQILVRLCAAHRLETVTDADLAADLASGSSCVRTSQQKGNGLFPFSLPEQEKKRECVKVGQGWLREGVEWEEGRESKGR